MEQFAKDMNIPLRDILETIDQIGMESKEVEAKHGVSARNYFLLQACYMFRTGFPTALPEGSRSRYELAAKEDE